MTALFKDIYGYNDLQIGLCYIPLGVGCGCASIVSGKLMDWNFARVGRKAGFTEINPKNCHTIDVDFPIKQARISFTYPLLYLGIACVICYGWALFKNAELAVPLVLTFIIGFTFASLIQHMFDFASRSLPPEP